jgi:hypothetical protein
MAVVVLPTPPFWFAIAMTLATVVSPRSECGTGADDRRSLHCTANFFPAATNVESVVDSPLMLPHEPLSAVPAYPQNREVVHRFCGYRAGNLYYSNGP